MRQKFKIYKECGELYKPNKGCLVVMNSQGIFFLYNGENYYPFIQHLSKAIGNYDVVWVNNETD